MYVWIIQLIENCFHIHIYKYVFLSSFSNQVFKNQQAFILFSNKGKSHGTCMETIVKVFTWGSMGDQLKLILEYCLKN